MAAWPVARQWVFDVRESAFYRTVRALRWVALLVTSCVCGWVQAGTQLEEPLIDSVRTALSAAVAQLGPPEPVHVNEAASQAYARWLQHTEAQLHTFLKRRESQAHELSQTALRREFLQTVWYESQRAGLDPSLVLGLIQVESGFRKFAISAAGARGYMQVMPFWTRVLSEGDASVLFQSQANLRFGCVILRHYLQREGGDLTLALGRYNGSRGQLAYPQAVLSAQRQWVVKE
jgi:soluble lytic murein transglycosylase-like protein